MAREPGIDAPLRVHIFTILLLSYLFNELSKALNHCMHLVCQNTSVRDGQKPETSPKPATKIETWNLVIYIVVSFLLIFAFCVYFSTDHHSRSYFAKMGLKIDVPAIAEAQLWVLIHTWRPCNALRFFRADTSLTVHRASPVEQRSESKKLMSNGTFTTIWRRDSTSHQEEGSLQAVTAFRQFSWRSRVFDRSCLAKQCSNMRS